MGCTEEPVPTDLHPSSLKLESDSKDVVDLLSVPNNHTDISVLLSNEDSIPTDLDENQLSEFYEGTVSNLEVNLTDAFETEKILNDSNTTPVAESSSFISRSIDSDAMLSFDKFENENAAKDATIASLKELNRELLDEIKFLREFQRENTRVSSANNELQGATTYDKDQFNDLRINSILHRTKLMSYSRKKKILKAKFFNYLKTHILKSDYPLPFH
jgi:hypothetical protein